jgi:hypothetical protein
LIKLFDSNPCTIKDESAKFQGENVKSLDHVNKHIPGRNNKEYFQDNEVKIQEQRKQNYLKNNDKIDEIAKQHTKENAE